MRVLYLTAESYGEPIIQSQVVGLLERLADDDEIAAITLVAFSDTRGAGEERSHTFGKVTHIVKTDRGTLRNILSLMHCAHVNRRGYDVLHVRSYLPMFAGVLAKALYGKKVLFDPRGLFAEEQSYPGGWSLLSFVFKRLEHLFCAISDAIVVVSEPFKDYLVNRYGLPERRVTVIPTFSSRHVDRPGDVDGEDIRKALRWEQATIFVYSGSLGEWQMVDDVIVFFARVHERIADARFVFLSQQTEEWSRLLRGRLPSATYAIRGVPAKLLSAEMSQCDFGVLFRADHIVNRVAAPIKVKDYLVAGLPIIISDHVGDSSDFVRRNGFGIVLSDLSQAEMTRAIEAIAAAPGSWDRSAIARVARACFDIGPVSERYRKLYRDLSPHV